MALASCLRRTAVGGLLPPTVLMSSPAALARSTCINTWFHLDRLYCAPSMMGSSFRRSRHSHARGSRCVAQASSQTRRHDRSQGSSPGGSEGRSCASDVDDGAEGDPEYHNTDLPTACARGYVKRVRLLLDQGADVNKFEWPKYGLGGTALQVAVDKGKSVELVQLLLERGAEVDTKDKWGLTPLHTVVGLGAWYDERRKERYAFPCVELLIKAGADIHALDKEGKTPLHWASQWGMVAVVRLLLEQGADVDARDEEGRTPLHAAAKSSRVGAKKVVELLVAAGANIKARDKKSNTVLHIAAAEWDSTALRPLLKQPGVQLDARNAGGFTPVAVAVHHANLEAVKVLHAAGADMVNPKLHRVPLIAWAREALDEVLEKDDSTQMDCEYRRDYLRAQGLNRVTKYLEAARVTAAAPSTPAKPQRFTRTPAKPRRGRPPRSAGGPAAGGSDSEE